MSEVEMPSADITAREAAREAEERGATAHVLDGSDLTSKRTTLEGIAAVLNFPEWTGRNLDALYDCLTDLSWLSEGEHVLIWSGAQTLAAHDPKAFGRIKAVLRDAAEHPICGRTFTSVLTER
ncbi:Barstar (barnase inhibitor) [Saccharopolyspora antimicrobica]|uniref:Barstar (Barnase inhibitor) n=2 Tax=Saccharopolyspora TaxID=1835 RepID=A0A1I4YRG6_9PSEU|nr:MULTISPECIES: barstar family protein [Saccharopolyspora]RKT82792.1 barstar (barnase inhibitor) [Saccharopolyspora antimicrobica]SEG92928.1 Barstar (barnase inhibitor) [Saccharopolyspora kobensis]SFD41375.1 Barstar (barnase inhibitor) [Saccharopolyspora kobensis]SFN40622.1 Barstar (barnase inhibitor) [Saccharopolyspora antimicrobica]